MKRHIIGLVMVMFGSYGSYFAIGERPYTIVVTTSGENNIVDAIQKYSNLTKYDEDRWKFSQVPFVGQYIRNGIREKIRNFIKVCQNLNLVNTIFQNGQQLIQAVPANWKIAAICRAFDSLESQGDSALALLGQIGVMSSEEQGWYEAINGKPAFHGQPGHVGYLKIIEWNKGLLAVQCQAIAQNRESKEQRDLRNARNKYEANKLYWEDMRLKWKMARDVSSGAFNTAKWMANTAYNMSVDKPGVSLMSGIALLYFYNKLFVTPYPVIDTSYVLPLGKSSFPKFPK
jgi:hypothetical protein